ncbi:MAG: nucleotide exchange factor GrpE [Methanothrix sp.]|jgi:molecular chaperone GrpE|nr:nucleotide exchange factor GrpE [Methanothrix sp.]
MEEGTGSNSKEPLENLEKKPAGSETPMDELKIQLEAASSLAAERLDQLLRCRAEMDNMQKRAAREKEDQVKYASEKLISKILPVLDSLEQASKHDEGTKVLYQQLLDILKGEGLASIDAAGQKFDPYKHEALYQLKSEELEEDTVAEEIQKGYVLNCRVIRFSKVAVAKR